MIVSADMTREMARLSRQLEDELDEVRQQVATYATAERNYRRAKAQAWLTCPSGGIAAQKAAWVDAESADHRYHRDLADGMRQAALEAVRSRRGQISALQSLLNAHRAEAEFDRTGPG